VQPQQPEAAVEVALEDLLQVNVLLSVQVVLAEEEEEQKNQVQPHVGLEKLEMITLAVVVAVA
tara:strand:+ start:383 stop:571 length:189 start_codon:yes stop_codon:yes gene_type:complete